MTQESNKLIFNKLSLSNFHQYARLVMNEVVMKYITGHALTLEEAEIRFKKAIDAGEKNDALGFFIVTDKVNREFIGVAKLVLYTDNQYEIGYMLLPEHWGKGFASEMLAALIRLARKSQIAELIGIVDPGNPASIRVLTKLGFWLFETGQIDGLEAAYYKLQIIE